MSPAIATASLDGQKLTVTFNDGGLEAGTIVTITVKAKLPASASADDNGATATTTFTATADNADTVSDSAAVTLDIPQELAANATKSVTPTTTQPASHVFTGLPVGAECAVQQTSASLAPHDVTFDPVGPSEGAPRGGRVPARSRSRRTTTTRARSGWSTTTSPPRWW